MDLRAFYKNNSTYSAYIYAFLLTNIVLTASAFGTTLTLKEKTPYEVKFADVVFQLNDATRSLLQREISMLEGNEEVKRHNLSYLSTYLPEVEPLIADAAVPDDFKFLVVYNKFQQSLTRSTLLDEGVFWCLDEQKAADVGMTINKYIDERKHLYAATEGALVCLRRNQVLYNNWGSTLFSHVADRSVLELLEVRRKWKDNNYLVLDSPAYASVIQFLAFKIVMEKNLQTFRPSQQMIVYKYPYGENKAFNVIAADLRIEPSELLKSNEWLKVNYVPKVDWPVVVVIPAHRYHEIRQLAEVSRNTVTDELDLGFPTLLQDSKLSKGKGGVFYRVNGKKGIQADLCDNFVTLSYMAKVSTKDFLKFNDMNDKDITNVGRMYYLESKNRKGPVAVHVVRESETLWDISQMYALKLDKLLKYNRLKTVQRVQEGRVVNLQKKRKKKEPIRYIEVENEPSPTDFMLTDPIFSERSNFKLEDQPIVVFDNKDESDSLSSNVEKVETDLKKEQRKEKVIIEVPTEPKTLEVVQDEKVYYVKEEDLKEATDKKVVKAEVPVMIEIDPRTLTQRMRENVTGIKEEKYLVHKVKKGETLYRISVNYKVSIDQLYKLNGLTNNIIEIGDEIKVKERQR